LTIASSFLAYFVVITPQDGDEIGTIGVIGARSTPSRPDLNTRPLMKIAAPVKRALFQPALCGHELKLDAALCAATL